jgi:hypothetical protein
MIIIFQVRHSDMDSLRAFLPGALRVNANPFQTPWMDSSLPSMALYTRFPAGMTIPALFVCNGEG